MIAAGVFPPFSGGKFLCFLARYKMQKTLFLLPLPMPMKSGHIGTCCCQLSLGEPTINRRRQVSVARSDLLVYYFVTT